LVDDGLATPEAGAWIERKYRLVGNYAKLFVDAAQGRWKNLVLVDLFAGTGRSRIEGTGRIVPSSPLVALDIPHPFNRYIFCEKDGPKLEALNERVGRDYPDRDVRFLHGDPNWLVDRIIEEMPPQHRDSKVLGLCFADPDHLENLKFGTIEKLSERFFDFLVLLPTGMETQRAVHFFAEQGRSKLDDFLGAPYWRAAWKDARRRGESAEMFLIRFFGEQMGSLGFKSVDPREAMAVRDERNLKCYRFGFYSRHNLAKKLAQQVAKASEDQLGFGF